MIDLETLYGLIAVACIVFIGFSILVVLSIISISTQLKHLVDLEYKKYHEVHNHVQNPY